MKKNIVKKVGFVGMVMGVLVLSGCGKSVEQLGETGNNLADRISERTALMGDDADAGVVGGIRGMLKGGASLKCVSNENGEEWTIYTNGKSFRGEGMRNGKKEHVLSIDGSMYTWNAAAKKGMKMEEKCLTEFRKDMGISDAVQEADQELDFSVENIEEAEASGNTHCTPSTQADFSVPKDVDFVDQCALLKQQMKGFQQQMKNFQK